MVASNSRIMSRRIEGEVLKVCVCMQSAVWATGSCGATPALDDPSESIVVAEGPAKDELEMGAVFAMLAVSTEDLCTLVNSGRPHLPTPQQYTRGQQAACPPPPKNPFF